jgi:hypothetical protein
MKTHSSCFRLTVVAQIALSVNPSYAPAVAGMERLEGGLKGSSRVSLLACPL